MKNVINAAFLLATLAVASPIDHQTRSFGMGMGGGATISSNHASGQGSQGSTTSSVTPFGNSFSTQQSSYAYSQDSVVQQFFNPMFNVLSQMNGMLSGGSLTQAMAAQYMSQIATQMQGAFGSFNQCGCITGGQMVPMFNSLFSQLSQTYSSMHSFFGAGSMSNIMGGFAPLVNSVSQFSSQFQSSNSFQSYSSAMSPFFNAISPMIPGFAGMFK